MKSNFRPSFIKTVHDCAFDHDEPIVVPIVPRFTNVNYIGIEIECLVTSDLMNTFITNLVLHNLQDKIILGYDSSIEGDEDNLEAIEIRLLTTEKTYKQDLFNLAKCLRLVNANVNDSCGLHVHLDTFNIKSNTLIKNLSRYKLFFKSLVPKSRRNNHHTEFDNNYNEHHNWINKSEHGTIEVRCHEGTINMKEVERFINLLLLVKQTRINKKQIANVTKLMKILNLTKTDSNYFLKRIKQFSEPKGDKYYV